VLWPCYYGIDFSTRAELIATGLSVEEIRRSLGADSLGYISMEGMIAATEQPAKQLCTACFSGSYPTPLPESSHLGKFTLEQPELPFDNPSPAPVHAPAQRHRLNGHGSTDVDGVTTAIGGGAEDALSRP
jgi:amidophosphoribosyltransferase